MIGNNFFVVGRKYKVITPRLGTKTSPHYLEAGSIVTCTAVSDAKGRMVGSRYVTRDIPRGLLAGLFVDSRGVDQTLYVGDVCRN